MKNDSSHVKAGPWELLYRSYDMETWSPKAKTTWIKTVEKRVGMYLKTEEGARLLAVDRKDREYYVKALFARAKNHDEDR